MGNFFDIPTRVVLCSMCVVSMPLSYLDTEFPLGINKLINYYYYLSIYYHSLSIYLYLSIYDAMHSVFTHCDVHIPLVSGCQQGCLQRTAQNPPLV